MLHLGFASSVIDKEEAMKAMTIWEGPTVSGTALAVRRPPLLALPFLL